LEYTSGATAIRRCVDARMQVQESPTVEIARNVVRGPGRVAGLVPGRLAMATAGPR
jgi:hypothetical protein